MLSVGYDLYQIFTSLKEADGELTTNIKPSEVEFRFRDYIIKSKEDRVRETTEGLASGVYDLQSAIDYVHEELSDTERLAIKLHSKIEKGMSLTPKEAQYFSLGEPEYKVEGQLEEEGITVEDVPVGTEDTNIEETEEET